MGTRRIQRGEPLGNADHQNLLIGQSNRTGRFNAQGRAPVQSGSNEPLLTLPPLVAHELYELTEVIVCPDGVGTNPDVPYSENALLVSLNHDTNDHGTTDIPQRETIWFPTAYRDCEDVNGYEIGDRVMAWFNPQTGRWEAQDRPCEPCASSSSSGENGAPSSSGAPCAFTGTLDVLSSEPWREGDSICFDQLRLVFEDGHLCSVAWLDEACVYLCCPDSSSSSESSGE